MTYQKRNMMKLETLIVGDTIVAIEPYYYRDKDRISFLMDSGVRVITLYSWTQSNIHGPCGMLETDVLENAAEAAIKEAAETVARLLPDSGLLLPLLLREISNKIKESK